MDTNHHYIVHDGCVHRKEGSIIIGNRCWIGNNSHISKGCVLPSNTILLLEVLWRRIIENVASIVY